LKKPALKWTSIAGEEVSDISVSFIHIFLLLHSLWLRLKGTRNDQFHQPGISSRSMPFSIFLVEQVTHIRPGQSILHDIILWRSSESFKSDPSTKRPYK
jgi:hypothetical protein